MPMPSVARRYPALGGDLARYALPFAVSSDEKTLADYKEKPNEAWGWLPPPLVGEGKKVQTEWLHDFLLDPFQIRPGRRAADAEVQHVVGRGEPAGGLFRRDGWSGISV